MALYLLALYIIIIFIRPMDWFGPVYNWPLVNNLALILIPASFLTATKENLNNWWKLPEVKIALFLLLGASMSSFLIWMGGVILIFQDFGKVILCYGIILLVVRRQKDFRLILWTIFLCIVWMAVHGILQIYRGYGFGNQPPIWRHEYNVYQIIAFGIFQDPNDLCLVFILALPLLYSEFRAAKTMIVKAISFSIMPLVVAAIWLTNSRGGIIGLFGILVGHSILKTKGIKRILSILIPGFIIFVLAPSRFASKYMNVDLGRADAWGEGMISFRYHPLFGIGYGNFPDIGEGLVAHNSFIHTLAELGIFGYLPWFLLIYITMTHLVRTLQLDSSLSRDDKFYITGLFSALSGYLTAIYFLSRQYNYILYILLAMALAKVVLIVESSDRYEQIFGEIKQDAKKGTIFALISIVIMWFSVRLVNMMGGR